MLGTRTTVATVSTRPRLECPACGRIVAATSVDTRYGPIEEVAWRGELVYGLCPHNDPNGHRCEGVSVFLPVATTPAPDTCAARLTVNLVPAAQWGANLSQALRGKRWDVLRRETYRRADHRCEVCDGVGSQHLVEAHEV